MKRSVFMFVVALMLVLLISFPCSAFTPTPTPTPMALTVSPTPTPILLDLPVPLTASPSPSPTMLWDPLPTPKPMVVTKGQSDLTWYIARIALQSLYYLPEGDFSSYDDTARAAYNEFCVANGIEPTEEIPWEVYDVLVTRTSEFRPKTTPTPMPTPTPRSTDSSGNHIHLSVSGLASEPRKHLLYSHENGIMADGFLMFVPLEEYVEKEQIPVISRGQFLSARITFDVYVESFSCSTDFFRKTEAGLERLGSIDLSVSDLSDAPYLVKMDCSAVHHGEAFRFFYLFWVE